MVTSNRPTWDSSMLETVEQKDDNKVQVVPSSFNTIVWILKQYYKIISAS